MTSNNSSARRLNHSSAYPDPLNGENRQKQLRRTTMATTKRVQCQFKVKEGINDPFIDAEPCSRESHSENPGTDRDYLSFDLRSGIRLDEAHRIALTS